MATPKYVKPTESELEILQILWQRDVATVRDVHEELAKIKDVGYTTTLKLMQIMHDKGLVKRDESMRT
ncbi:MAG TPA: BlaI/MecI/CopY family transcriptional regulator, partial [Flavisolibacter sp.]